MSDAVTVTSVEASRVISLLRDAVERPRLEDRSLRDVIAEMESR